MNNKLFEIGDCVINTMNKTGKIIAYSMRDKIWSSRHIYLVRWDGIHILSSNEEWVLQEFISKLEK